MSYETWEGEFYGPMPAEDSVIEAVEHSLQKWIGLRAENLQRHDVRLTTRHHVDDVAYPDDTVYTGIRGEADYDERLAVDSRSCALCVYERMQLQQLQQQRRWRCQACPLCKWLGRPCDVGTQTPYIVWRRKADPEPMIYALKATLRALKRF